MYTPNGGVVSTDGFYLTDQGVEVFFRPDELKYYADEFPQFPVSFEALQADINENGSFWEALQKTNGSISEPSNADIAKVESLGFQPFPFGYAITRDQQNNTLVAILATDPTLGMQTFFFVNDRYLGTDTLKPYQGASLRPNGLGSIDISYSDGTGTGPTITYHWDGHKLQPNKGFPSNWSWSAAPNEPQAFYGGWTVKDWVATGPSFEVQDPKKILGQKLYYGAVSASFEGDVLKNPYYQLQNISDKVFFFI